MNNAIRKDRFEYYQIRPCVEFHDHVESYMAGDNGDGNATPSESWEKAVRAFANSANTLEPAKGLFWTLYGYREDTGEAVAIGDYKSFDAAYEVMNLILCTLGNIHRVIDEESAPPASLMKWAYSHALDVCNQSSNEERL